MRLDDPDLVRREYASEDRLAARKAGYRFAEGPDPRELVFEAVAEARPRRILEVGCGEGELAERLQRELGAEVVAIDQSARMVEITRGRGVDARIGDVQDLSFADGEFDVAVAAWVLFHVPDVDRALSELARVARRLVAVTNGGDHLCELGEVLGAARPEYAFAAETAQRQLRRHFAAVDAREAHGWVTFPSRVEAQEFVDHTIVWGDGRQLPEVEGPVRVRRTPVVFVADK